MRARNRLGRLAPFAAALALGCLWPASAGTSGIAVAGGFSFDLVPARDGIALAGSPYRWQAIATAGERPATLVERIDRRGGRIARWWQLDGRWQLTAPAYDGQGAGLAGDESVLVLTRAGRWPDGMRRRTELAVLEPGPRRPGGAGAVRRVSLRGDFGVYAISPDGSTLFLTHWLAGPPGDPRFRLRAYDLSRQRLLPAAAIGGDGAVLGGTPMTRLQDVSGHHVYTLYMKGAAAVRRNFLLALDTFGRTLRRIEPPGLRGEKNPGLLTLHLDAAGQRLVVRAHSVYHWVERERTVARIDLRRWLRPRLAPPSPRSAPQARAPSASAPQPRPAAHPIGLFSREVGESAAGRPIEMLEVGDLSLPGRLLVFGCVHGDECGASALVPRENGCPDPDLHAYVVPNLDPDGSAAKSRLNARGVDLNRNFAAGWRPVGTLGSLEYAGLRPFSEPESRLAARLIRRLQPRATIWFHQDWGDTAYVRAWGQSVPAGRRFAQLAGIEFRRLPWPAGTAPNWQNHRFPGAASFVVETPRGRLGDSLRERLTAALSEFGEGLEEDPGVPRKG